MGDLYECWFDVFKLGFIFFPLFLGYFLDIFFPRLLQKEHLQIFLQFYYERDELSFIFFFFVVNTLKVCVR